jgi:hypothetical protein
MTSIDWLIKKIESFGIDTKFISESINEAKEMHKQEMATNISQLEILEDDINKIMRSYNITDFGQMAAFITGAKWAIEKLNDEAKKRAANYMNLKRK